LKKVIVPGLEPQGDKPLELLFPEKWDVTRCAMEGEGKPVLRDDEIKAVLENPVGAKPLSKLVEGHKEVVILFDDSTRPSKTFRVIPFVLEALEKEKIPEENIRFIMASGSHGPHGRLDFVRKLGEDIVDRYAVYNHNPYDNLMDLGKTSRGTPVKINAEVMGCDLKIAIGSIHFHRLMGFSGGSKIISPGVAGIETIQYNHGNVGGFGPGFKVHPTCGYLKNEGNVMRLDSEETARMAGLDFKVDMVNNVDRDPIAIFAGDFVQEQRLAAQRALKEHATEAPKEMDIVVANAYARGNEASLAMWAANTSVKEDGAIVLIPNAPDGDINHWIFGRHGKWLAGRLASSSGPPRPLARGRRIIIYSPYKDHGLRMGLPEQRMWVKTWVEVVEELKNDYPGHAKVAVYPDATVQFPKPV
jgi:nickel-dependent lactate racemase